MCIFFEGHMCSTKAKRRTNGTNESFFFEGNERLEWELEPNREKKNIIQPRKKEHVNFFLNWSANILHEMKWRTGRA